MNALAARRSRTRGIGGPGPRVNLKAGSRNDDRDSHTGT